MAKVSLRAYNREIETMIDRNNLEEAVAHCQHILKTFPKHLETYRLLGKAYLEARRHNEAVDIFTRVLASEPNDFVAHVGMSIIRDEQGKLDDAIWHMERAYEVQSANPAIQGELQRLYGRRDGMQPPRIRMTRGALAHMYIRGELYPQAISETKGILNEDPGRSDMQVLLAKAYYRSGQKKDAADAASTVLKRYPFCLDANLVLAEILGVDRPESAQVYRHRVVELDPYAAQVVDDMFRANEVSDAAVSIDHLEWDGQPIGMSADWGAEKAIALESGIRDRDAQPDWLKESFPADGSSALSALPFDSEQEVSATPAQPAEEIPDFLRAAGWAASTGAFDESKSSMFEDEPAPSAEPIAQGDLPDWVKAMAPQDSPQPAEGQEEEMPDWINKIGTNDLPVPSAESSDETDWLSGLGESSSTEQSDWMKGFGTEEQPTAQSSGEQMDWIKSLGEEEQPASQTSEEQPEWMKGFGQEEQPVSSSDEQPDWMKGFGGEEQPVASQSTDEQPDWIKGFEQEEQPASSSDEQPDWMKGFGEEEQPVASQSMNEQPDWIKGFGQEEQPVSATDEQPDWINDFGKEEQPASVDDGQLDWLQNLGAESGAQQSSSDFDFIDELTRETEEPVPSETPALKVDTGSLGTSEEEQDDSFAWLENLAAKQGATEGLLTKPEERLEDEPDWIKQAKSLNQPEMQPAEEMVPESKPTPQPTASVEDLGKSGVEIDDALAWFEGLAAKQGATEGLLTKPEDRSDQEPEWIKKVKSSGNAQQSVSQQPPAQEEPPVVETPLPTPEEQPSANVADLGKSGQEIDDALAWFEGLAAKQGATEGLLTKPEERLEQEPEWVKQATSAAAQQPVEQIPVEEEVVPEPEPSLPTPPVSEVKESGESGEDIDDALAWFEGLAAKQGATEGLLTKPEDRLEQEPEWVKQQKEAATQQPSTQETPVEEENISETEPEVEEHVPGTDTIAWLKGLADEEEERQTAPVEEELDTVAWLKTLDEPEEEPITLDSASDDLPGWMQSISEEEVTKPEATVPMEEAEAVDESPAPVEESTSDEIPNWLSGIEEEQAPSMPASEDLPAWMRDETGEVVAEPTKIEPTRSADWRPVDEKEEEPAMPPLSTPEPAPEPMVEPKPEPKPEAKPAPKAKKPAPKKEEIKPAAPPEPYKEPVTQRGAGMLSMPIDPILGSARAELSRSNIPGALETYGKLIKKGRFLEEVIYDLREALYRYPVEVNIWQTLGDAYMRANQLQDALDAYTKAEELLR